MLAKVSIHPEPPIGDMTVPFLVLVGLLAVLFVMDWVRHRA